MKQTEGVIQYRLEHQWHALNNSLELRPLMAWRDILYKLELIGQHPERYDGLGYGNLSQRCPDAVAEFIISGTQTGHLPQLCSADFASVLYTAFRDNHIIATGLAQPSSEALTHAAVYQAQPAIQAVVHVHAPLIWRLTAALELAAIPASATYGSVNMAGAVYDLLQQQPDCRIFSMLGHEDGIVACGEDLDAACLLLIQTLARALALSPC